MRDATAVSAMLCPVCKVGLAMSDRQSVEIDYCPQCRGVWLDRGELDKIIERANAADAAPQPAAPPQPQQPPQPYAQPAPGYPPQPHRGGYDDRHQYGYKKRRKSFLEELFD